MARYGRLLADAQWEKIRPLLPKRPRRSRGGRPPANDRKVLEGILWILRSGARWQDLPDEFPSPATCWRRLRDWEEQGVWLTIWRAFLAELNQREQLNWSESFLDGSFAPAKKGPRKSGKPIGSSLLCINLYSLCSQSVANCSPFRRTLRLIPSLRRVLFCASADWRLRARWCVAGLRGGLSQDLSDSLRQRFGAIGFLNKHDTGFKNALPSKRVIRIP